MDKIKVGDFVAWEHDPGTYGKVIELLSNEFIDIARVQCLNGKVRDMLLDECVPKLTRTC